MITVTAYCNGSPVLYGRGLTEDEALANAKRLRDDLTVHMPRLADPRMWNFQRDVCDRQLFQPAKIA